MNLIVKQTTNSDEIKSVLFHESIFNHAKGDLDIKPDFELPFENIVYIGGYDKNIIGVSCFHFFMDGLKIHPYVLPNYRIKHARDFVRLSISMVRCPLYAEIPKNRKRLFNLAKKLGFDSVENNKTDKTLMRFI